MGIIKAIIELFHPGGENGTEDSTQNPTRSGITNQVLYNELIEHFKSEMDNLSVGKRILYPMSFNILLHPDDYGSVGESLPFILPEVIAGFYAAIKTKSESISGSDTTPPATYWFFQFAASSVKTENGEESFIRPGEIITVGHLTTFDIKKAQQGTRVENSKLSIKCINSNVNANNINQEALLGMDILTNNTFRFNFDKDMSQKTSDIQGSQRDSTNALATLSYALGHDTMQLEMLDNSVYLSGSDETRNSPNILIIKNKAVVPGHVQIRYDKDKNLFQLCAFEKTSLNHRILSLSEGGNLIWYNLAYNSDIFLNDEVNVTFKASESIRAKGPTKA